jgi:hypothetical protein
MNANHDLERRLADFYASEALQRAPDRVLESVLAASEITRQRRAVIRLPWRFPIMNSYAKVAIAAVAVIAIGAVGLAVLRPGTSPGVGGQVVTPSPEPSSSGSPPATNRPTSSPSLAPPLTQSFTSTLHGISMSYPEGWTAQAATEPWTGRDPALFRMPQADFLVDTGRFDHLFLSVASQPIGDSTPGEWAAEKLTYRGCAASEPITVDGATGLIGADDCNAAAVTMDGRGYIIWLYTSPDEPSLSATYDTAWFEDVLATVQLKPEGAVDASPSASP